MKRTLFLLFAFCMLAASKALAYEWTDGNGVTWTFFQSNFTINGTSQSLWYISGASGYGENVTVPQTVYNGGTACTIEAMRGSFVSGTNVTLPSTIKYIDYGAFDFYAGTVKINSTTPPTLGVYDNNPNYHPNFGAGVTVLVPAASLNAYRNADVWSNYAVRIISQSAKTSYDVNVTAQASSSGIHQAIGEDNLINVMSLKVKGSINSYDIMIIRNKMHNLHHLDLSNANIVASSYEYYDKYNTTDNVLGDYTFYQMTKLITVKMPNTITSIGVGALYYCDGLKTVTIPNSVITIGNYAFESCSSLASVTMGNGVTNIGRDAFEYCNNLAAVHILDVAAWCGITFADYDANPLSIAKHLFMSGKEVTDLTIPTGVTSINAWAFYGWSNLNSVIIPNSVTSIGNNAFYRCTSLKEIHIPSSIRTIGYNAFSGCTSLKDYYTYTVEPTSIEESTFSNWTTATLHIPTLAYYHYYWDTQWSKFAFLVEDNNYKYEYFYLNHDLTFNTTTTGLATPDVDLNAGSGIIVDSSSPTVNLENVHVASSGTSSASIIANNNLTVENLYFDLTVAKNKWYFVTFPFRVKLTNVTSPGNFVFRYYDGAERATNGKGGWKNVTGSYLNAGQGYIFQTNTDGTLTLKVEKADMDFSGNTKQDVLNTYTASSTANASWNFLGNPHPCYYDINKTGYTAPITVWTGSAYQAVRAGDDTYFMKPFQAFFVQKPEGTSSVNFPANGRYTYQQTQEQTASARRDVEASFVPARSLVNLTIGTLDNSATDRTRVVYNDAKTTAYEMDCDAAKFFSDGLAAQLYTIDADGTQYAINERPLGEVALGYVAAIAGELTISAVRMDRPVYLLDNELGITHDLSLGGYTFNTDAGINESRFTLVLVNNTTGIAEIEDGTLNNVNTVYDLQGRRINERRKGSFIVKDANGVTKKVIMK